MARTVFSQIDSYNKKGKKSTKRTAEEAMWIIVSNGSLAIRSYIESDGSGYVQVTRDGEPLERLEYEPLS